MEPKFVVKTTLNVDTQLEASQAAGGRFSRILTLVLLALALTGATLAYLITHTDPVPNRFTPAHVSCNVTEDFDGTTKKNVNVTNTGDIEAYLRVKLVTYRVNDDGQHIGGTAASPAFTPGNGWVKDGDY